jgi:hypothetical protein
MCVLLVSSYCGLSVSLPWSCVPWIFNWYFSELNVSLVLHYRRKRKHKWLTLPHTSLNFRRLQHAVLITSINNYFVKVGTKLFNIWTLIIRGTNTRDLVKIRDFTSRILYFSMYYAPLRMFETHSTLLINSDVNATNVYIFKEYYTFRPLKSYLQVFLVTRIIIEL